MPPLPQSARIVIVGAGIHGLSVAAHLSHADDVVIVDKSAIGAGASGIACGVVRNNYFQPAMRELMAHSVGMWESDPQSFSYHGVGYLQVSMESMREQVRGIAAQQEAIGYESEFIEGEEKTRRYMQAIFPDWQATGVTSVLHEKRGGYANNMASLRGLAKKAQANGAVIAEHTAVVGFDKDAAGAVRTVKTTRGDIACEQVVIAVGPWVRDCWRMLDLPPCVSVRGNRHREEKPMWRYWSLQEGTLGVSPDFLSDANGQAPPVTHVDCDAPLSSIVDGRVITDQPWGIYYKPDFHFNGVQGGAAPNEVLRAANEVSVDPYGANSPEFVVGEDFAEMWMSALAHCQSRFADQWANYRREPSGGIGCFTPDNFPVFDRVDDGNVYWLADSNHGYKMLGVGALVAQELEGSPSVLLAPFRYSRFADGKTHPTSNSPFPWS